MSSWRDYARKIEAPGPGANSAASANSPPAEPQKAPIGTNGTNGAALPASIRSGLAALAKAPAPRLKQPEAWPAICADAQRLADDGWVAIALAMGWDAFDLFGAVSDPHGDPDANGLAVWLDGRKVLAICGAFVVAMGSDGRAYFNRRERKGARLLWTLGGCRIGDDRG